MCEHHSQYSNVEKSRIAMGKPKQRMPIALIKHVLERAKNSGLKEIIPSTMGEPLLYRDFEKILDLCTEYDVKLNLTTNGTFPMKGVKEWAEKIVPIATDVKISWNGSTKRTQEKIMRGTNFETGINNIKEFLEIRNLYAENVNNYCRVTLQLTFMEENLCELVDIVKLGIKLGVDRIKGHHVWTHFQETKSSSLRKNPESIARWNQVVIEAQQVANNNPLANGKKILLENFIVLDERAMVRLLPNSVCPFLGKEAWIAADGHFSPCCAPNDQRQLLGDFGNVHEKNIDEIWHDSEYQNLCKNYTKHPVCIACNMRKAINEAS